MKKHEEIIRKSDIIISKIYGDKNVDEILEEKE